MQLLTIVLLSLLLIGTSAESSESDAALTSRDFVGRYSATMSVTGVGKSVVEILIDVASDSVRFECGHSNGELIFSYHFPLDHAQFGVVGAHFSLATADSTFNLWIDRMGTGQISGRLERISHDPLDRRVDHFRSIAAAAPIAEPPDLLPNDTFQQRHRTCSYRHAESDTVCGRPTTHPTGLCREHTE